MIFGRENPTPHNHQASDGPDYEGCPACMEVDECPMCKDTGWAVTSGDVMFRCPSCTDQPTAEQAAYARSWGWDV